jgi:hypothetical protein
VISSDLANESQLLEEAKLIVWLHLQMLSDNRREGFS